MWTHHKCYETGNYITNATRKAGARGIWNIPFVNWRHSGQSVASSLLTSHKALSSLVTSTEVKLKKYQLAGTRYLILVKCKKRRAEWGELSWYCRWKRAMKQNMCLEFSRNRLAVVHIVSDVLINVFKQLWKNCNMHCMKLLYKKLSVFPVFFNCLSTIFRTGPIFYTQPHTQSAEHPLQMT